MLRIIETRPKEKALKKVSLLQSSELKIDLVSYLFLIASLLLWANFFQGKTSFSDYLALQKSQGRLKEAVIALDEEIKLLEEEIHKLEVSKDYAKKKLKERYHLTESQESIIFFDE